MAGLGIDGLVSGFDTTAMIEQLLALEQRPITTIQGKIDTTNEKKTAFLDMNSRLLSFQSVLSRLKSGDSFAATNITSSNESVLTATSSSGVSTGSFTFRVKQLAEAAQGMSRGFADRDTTAVGAGKMRIEFGNSQLLRDTTLNKLNGGDGVRLGKIKITDRTGSTDVVDLSGARTLSDVVDLINDSSVNVTASIDTTTGSRDNLIISDNTGAAITNLIVENGSGSYAATDLGINQSVAGATLTGSNIITVNGDTALSDLNDGLGINNGELGWININGVNVDLSDDLTTLDQVVDEINDYLDGTALTGRVYIDPSTKNRLLVSGGNLTFDTYTVDRTDRTALELGLVDDLSNNNAIVAGNTGNRLVAGANSILLRNLNGGSGVSLGQIYIRDRDNNISGWVDTSTLNISDLEDFINEVNDLGTNVRLTYNDSRTGLKVYDTSTGTNEFSIIDNQGDRTWYDLGLAASGTVGTVVAAGTQFTTTDAAGWDVTEDGDDVFDYAPSNFSRIHFPSLGTYAFVNSYDPATDTVTMAGGNAPIGFGVGDEYFVNFRSSTISEMEGTNLNMRTMTGKTRLDDLNMGQGVDDGSIRITDSANATSTVDLSSAETVQDVLDLINAATVSVTASINTTGDGILLTDTAGGGGNLAVIEMNDGTTAADLNIYSSGSGTTIDGSYDYTLTISATDTLLDVKNAIDDLGLNINANIVDDGSGANPYRLSITAKDSGEAAGFIVDNWSSTLDFSQTAFGKDAEIQMGSTSPITFTSGSNTMTGVMPGLTLNLKSASTAPVTINIDRDTDSVVSDINSMVDTFNNIMERIAELTSFDTETFERGILLGDTTLTRIETTMVRTISNIIDSQPAGYDSLVALGMRYSSSGSLSFDETALRTALSNDFEAVEDLFSEVPKVGETTLVRDLNDGNGLTLDSTGNDLWIKDMNGAEYNIDLDGDMTISDIISSINTATGGNVKLEIDDSGTKLKLVDYTGATTNVLQMKNLGTAQVLSGLGFFQTKASSTSLTEI